MLLLYIPPSTKRASSGVLLPLQGVPQRLQEDGRVAPAAGSRHPAQALPVHPVQQTKAEEQRAREWDSKKKTARKDGRTGDSSFTDSIMWQRQLRDLNM